MNTTSYLRTFIVVAMMTATACTEPDVMPIPKPKPKPVNTSSTQISNHQFHGAVTTWSRPDGTTYVGFVQNIPQFDLSKASITAGGNKVAPFLDVTKLSNTGSNKDYFWASIQNNILLLYYVGPTPSSVPPFPLDVTIVY